jgi:SOS-response transcriptional repressor LexA
MAGMDIAAALAAAMQRAGLTQYELAKRSGVPQPTIQRILSRETASPKSKTVKRLAATLGVTTDSLIGSAGKPAGVPLADDGARAPNRGAVPVIPFASAGVASADTTVSPATMATTWIPCPVEHGERTFAFVVPDDAMAAPGGGKTYPAGCFVYIDPDRREPTHDKPVLARLAGGQTVLANYMAQAGRVWLRLLNTAYPPITDAFEVLGVVIFKGEEP